MSLVEHGFDLGVRFGNLPDSNLIIRRLADNHRVLVASPDYLKQYGISTQPKDLEQHRCLVMERLGEPLNEWRFHSKETRHTVKVKQAFISNDGSNIRQWALAGAGIAYKSMWDVKGDIGIGKLVTILDDFVLGFQGSDNEQTGLQLVYPNRQYLPRQVAKFIEFFQAHLAEKN
jgi:DNA-binding transcriptional LysR family regulator